MSFLFDLTKKKYFLVLNPDVMGMYFSGLHLIRTALDLKQEYTGDHITFDQHVKRNEFWEIPEVLFFFFLLK